MKTEALIEIGKIPLISAVIAAIVAAFMAYFVSKSVAKYEVEYEVRYTHVKLQTIEMNSAVKSLADNIYTMMSLCLTVTEKKYGIDINRSQQDKFESLSQEIYGIVKKTNILSRTMDDIKGLEKIRFDEFLKQYNENAYQIYREYKINLFGDILDEKNKIGLTHKMLWGKNIAGKSFYDVLMEIDMKIIQRYFKEQW